MNNCACAYLVKFDVSILGLLQPLLYTVVDLFVDDSTRTLSTIIGRHVTTTSSSSTDYEGRGRSARGWLMARDHIFRSKFFHILPASLPNSTAHRGKFSTYSNKFFTIPELDQICSSFVAGKLPQLTDTVSLPNKLAAFQLSSMTSTFLPLQLEWQSCISWWNHVRY